MCKDIPTILGDAFRVDFVHEISLTLFAACAFVKTVFMKFLKRRCTLIGDSIYLGRVLTG